MTAAPHEATRPLAASRVRQEFLQRFGASTTPGVAMAPGRVNLIGEHTDYNDGWVLPMAIDRHTAVAFRARPDRILRAWSTAFAETRSMALDGGRPPVTRTWFDYVAGVACKLGAMGHRLPGVDLLIHGDVPIGAGLSSSASLDLAVARALCSAAGVPWNPVAMANACRHADNEYVGVPCGVMDQFASAMGREGYALLLDCRTLDSELVAIPGHVAVVVLDTGVRRALAHGEYEVRQRACVAATGAVRTRHPDVRALRDVTPAMLDEVRETIGDEIYRRARHVVEEMERPVLLAGEFRRGDMAAAGRLMNDSHQSLRDLYEVSSPELDRMVDLAREQPGCFGARMTGAGFGGCAIALVLAESANVVARAVEESYRREADRGAAYVCRAADGARIAA